MSAQQKIIRNMSPKGKAILQKLLLAADSDRATLYSYVCHLSLLAALGQFSGPLKVPDEIAVFFAENDGRPGTLIHLDTCRSCGCLIPFLNYFKENRMLRYFETCPACGREMK